ncbi:myeloid cell surface antigen CD33-like [Mustela nigripes]|uniref:myeloid cell surface antigen CD33-like n=1 Tax=Mustela nigripes TaxID=77151 RepID=UPI002815D2DE|nr:myeloid cell surface antigen CD33-like [Mustela nigripes]
MTHLDHILQVVTQGCFHLPGDSEKYNCALNITDTRRIEAGTYFFRVERGNAEYNYLYDLFLCMTHLSSVLTLIPRPQDHGTNLTCQVYFPAAGVMVERTIQLKVTCECGARMPDSLMGPHVPVRAVPIGSPPLFSWTSAALTSLGPRTHLSSVLTLIPRPQDHGTNLTCQVYFPAAGVMVERTIQLNVTCATQNPTTGVFLGHSPGKLGIWSGVILGAVSGAGITMLLALCLCLIFFGVKSCRKTASRRAVGMDGSPPVVEPAPLDYQQKSKSDLPADPTISAGVPPTSEMEQDLHYASISFHRMEKGTYAEYSEIRTQ